MNILNLKSGSSKVIINLISKVIVALTGIFFVPIYIKLIGVESYGLVAFYGTLAGALLILDLGLNTAISRQVAILKAQEETNNNIQNLVLSVEVIYWALGLLVGVGVYLLAHPIAMYWVKAKDLPIATIEEAVKIMGFVLALQFPVSIYNGVMIGIEKQIPNAVISALSSLFKALGAIAVLKLVHPTIEWYFIWQIVSTGTFTFFLRYLTKHYLHTPNYRPRFSLQQLRAIRQFAAGMIGISVITFFLSQADKIIVSKFVLLEFVGYYNLAFMIAGVLPQIVSPLQSVVFPRFSAFVAQNKQRELTDLYHKGCRWIAIVVFPVGFTLIFFAKEILLFWTHNPVLAQNTAPILQTFMVGSICNCLMWMPYFFMLAKGNTKFTIYQNIIAAAILVPLLFWWTNHYGAFGASLVWLCVNAGYIIFSLPLFHRFFLKGELLNWYRNDIALPLVVSLILVVGAKLSRELWLPELNIIGFGFVLFLITVLYLLIIPELRGMYHKFRLALKF